MCTAAYLLALLSGRPVGSHSLRRPLDLLGGLLGNVVRHSSIQGGELCFRCQQLSLCDKAYEQCAVSERLPGMRVQPIEGWAPHTPPNTRGNSTVTNGAP